MFTVTRTIRIHLNVIFWNFEKNSGFIWSTKTTSAGARIRGNMVFGCEIHNSDNLSKLVCNNNIIFRLKLKYLMRKVITNGEH